MDDFRIVANSEESCWKVLRRILSLFQSLGIQDAARKRRSSKQGGNPWAGAIVHASEESISVTVSEDKWRRGKEIINSCLQPYIISNNSSKVWLDFKALKREELS